MPGAFARLGPRLAEAFAGAGCEPDADVAFARFRPSGLLAQAILDGSEAADVYVSANVLWMRRLQRAGLVRRWTTLARNRLCLIGLASAPPRALRDVARPVAMVERHAIVGATDQMRRARPVVARVDVLGCH